MNTEVCLSIIFALGLSAYYLLCLYSGDSLFSWKKILTWLPTLVQMNTGYNWIVKPVFQEGKMGQPVYSIALILYVLAQLLLLVALIGNKMRNHK